MVDGQPVPKRPQSKKPNSRAIRIHEMRRPPGGIIAPMKWTDIARTFGISASTVQQIDAKTVKWIEYYGYGKATELMKGKP